MTTSTATATATATASKAMKAHIKAAQAGLVDQRDAKTLRQRRVRPATFVPSMTGAMISID